MHILFLILQFKILLASIPDQIKTHYNYMSFGNDKWLGPYCDIDNVIHPKQGYICDLLHQSPVKFLHIYSWQAWTKLYLISEEMQSHHWHM